MAISTSTMSLASFLAASSTIIKLLEQISLFFKEGGGILDGGNLVNRGLGERGLIRHGDAPSDQIMERLRCHDTTIDGKALSNGSRL